MTFSIMQNGTKAYSSSLLRQIIACSHLPFLKIFSNFAHFWPNFKVFCPFSTFHFPFSEKSRPCPYFLEQALATQSFDSRDPYTTLGLADPSSITIILLSEVQTLLSPYSSLAIHKEIKLSVTDIFVPLNFLLFTKTFFLILHLVNLIISARHFLRALFLSPIRCVRSKSDGQISSPRCALTMPIDRVSVPAFRFSSTSCIRKQFRLEYCSCS